MQPRFPAVGRIDIPGNDSRHNFTDPNQGGGPFGGAGTKRVPPAQRGGFAHQGQRVHVKAKMPTGRGSSGNPASRGGFRGQARGGAFQPESRIRSHGGSPQHRGGAGTGADFGRPGQSGVPGGNPTQARPGAGNTSGRSYQLIAGRFKRAAMGARPTGNSGKYGSPPVSSNT